MYIIIIISVISVKLLLISRCNRNHNNDWNEYKNNRCVCVECVDISTIFAFNSILLWKDNKQMQCSANEPLVWRWAPFSTQYNPIVQLFHIFYGFWFLCQFVLKCWKFALVLDSTKTKSLLTAFGLEVVSVFLVTDCHLLGLITGQTYG